MTRHETGTARAYPPFASQPDIACRGADLKVFYPQTGNTAGDEAKAICRRCPHIDECLAWALDTEQRFGIWGGTGPEDRDQLRPRPPRPQGRPRAADVAGERPIGNNAGERNGRRKLTAEKVREIRRLHADGRSAYGLARAFGVAPSTVQNILTGKLWRSV